jgi:hypothetical protein
LFLEELYYLLLGHWVIIFEKYDEVMEKY